MVISVVVVAAADGVVVIVFLFCRLLCFTTFHTIDGIYGAHASHNESMPHRKYVASQKNNELNRPQSNACTLQSEESERERDALYGFSIAPVYLPE